MTSPVSVDPVGLRDLATDTAEQAAALLRDGLARERATVDTKSTGTDMVTEMDRASERLCVEALLSARPDDGVLGEEGAEWAGTSGVRWIIDPLDGTTNYLYGHPGFAVSIAAEVDGRAIVGVVLDVLAADVFDAVTGRGARRNGQPISVGGAPRLADALVATGFGYDARRRAEQAALLSRVIGRVRDIRRMGAAAVDLCSVACGRVDAYYERGLQPWDLAAGGLIAAEAGATVSGLSAAEPADEAFVLAAPPALHAELAAVLQEAGAAEVG